MSSPSGLHLDLSANIVIADRGYHRVISFGLVCRMFIFLFFSFQITIEIIVI